jgi:hypothetical protein
MTAFKNQWNSIKTRHLLNQGLEEIQSGLEAIFSATETYKYCIFIGGLDEFNEDPGDVVQKILD